MNSRERVRRTLEFKQPDRAPWNLWALGWVYMYAKDQMEALQREFPDDFIGAGYLGKSDRYRGGDGRGGTDYVDEWGSVWSLGEDGVAGEVTSPVLADWSALATFQPPREILERADYDAVNRAQDANLRSANPKWLNCGTSVRPFERLQFLRGSQNLFLDMGYDSAEFRRLRAMVHEYFLQELENVVKTNCDSLNFMDDWGAQNALLISPEMWRAYYKPLYKDYCDLILGAGKKVFFHSDGHIASIYPDLIELGVSAVNSQLFCMDIEDLAQQYKGKITFWGEIDRQKVLPFGTVEDVRRAVGRVRRALDDGRGGVIAQCEWGKNNPPANIRAVFEAWTMPIETLPR
jgi:uroporphyrinogen decarboxylase